jgi:hypothetical protein
MNQQPNLNPRESEMLLQEIITNLWGLAENHEQDTLFLLSLLRDLESIHRKIRSEMFESSLPSTRNKLYQLVKDIEEEGGWPYIERMKLQELLKNIQFEGKDITNTSLEEYK